MLGACSLVVPFVACGDLNGYDADKSYPLQLEEAANEYMYTSPVCPPIKPNYNTFMQRKKTKEIDNSV